MFQPSIDRVKFDPPRSTYHQTLFSQQDFRNCLHSFILASLLPQLDDLCDRISGEVTPLYNEDKYCKPSSLVRDFYRIQLSFWFGNREIAIFDMQLQYVAESNTFVSRHQRRKLYVWTQSRKARQQVLAESVALPCRQICQEQIMTTDCPNCSKSLNICNHPSLFDVSCQNGCFSYNFHRNPDTKEFLHGHTLFGEPS
jgi:hypothetical protein